MGLPALQSIVSVRPVEHRVLDASLSLEVSLGDDRYVRTPSATDLRRWFHPLVSFTPLQSVASSFPLPTSRQRAPSLGLRSLFATSTSGHRATGSQARHFPVRDVSHVLDGLLRHQPRGFISPHYHVQGSPFRGCPYRAAVPSRRRPMPSRRWRCLAADGYPPAPRNAAPPTGLSSTRESDTDGLGFNQPASRSPPGLAPPPGAPSLRRENAFTFSTPGPWKQQRRAVAASDLWRSPGSPTSSTDRDCSRKVLVRLPTRSRFPT